MVQARPPRLKWPPAGAPVARSARARAVIPSPGAASLEADDIPDRLGSMTDRDDLERLFARHVDFPSILRLMGKQVSREQIQELLESPDLHRDLKKLLE